MYLLGRIGNGSERPALGSRRGGGGRKARSCRGGRKSSVGDGAQRLRGRSVAGEHCGRKIEQGSCN